MSETAKDVWRKRKLEKQYKSKDNEYKSNTNVQNSDTFVIQPVNRNESINNINKSVVEIFFDDLPASTHFENIIRNLNIPKEKLITKIPEFRKAAKVEYPNFVEFCNHFKNWVKKQEPPKGIILKTSFK